MKINFSPAQKINVLFIIALCNCFLAFQACDDYPDPSLVTIEGMVVNEETGEGIASAEVEMLNNTETTDVTGKFTLIVPEELIPDTSFVITTKATGFVSGMTYANKQTLSALPFISLIPTREPVSIGPEGGNVIIPEVTESLNPNDHIQLIIPQNALTETEDISVTPLQGNDVPGRSPMASLGLLNMATVNLEPSGLELAQDGQLEFPLPFQSDQGEVIPLLLFNDQTMQWEDTGDSAVVDQSGTKATANISHFSTYSIGVQGQYTEETPIVNNTEVVTPIDCKIIVQDSLTYPNGIPDNINPVWLKNIVAQNSIEASRPDFYKTKSIWICNNESEFTTSYNENVFSSKKSKIGRHNTTLNDTLTCCPNIEPAPECINCSPKKIYKWMKCGLWVHESLEFEYVFSGFKVEERIANLIWVTKYSKCQTGWDCPCHEGGGGE